MEMLNGPYRSFGPSLDLPCSAFVGLGYGDIYELWLREAGAKT